MLKRNKTQKQNHGKELRQQVFIVLERDKESLERDYPCLEFKKEVEGDKGGKVKFGVR